MPLGDGAEAADFVLPDELLAALPRDPYEQLDLARRITALAVSGRVSGLEREAGRLRAEAAGKDRENAELRERVVLLDTALQETNARLRAALEDNVGRAGSWPRSICSHLASASAWVSEPGDSVVVQIKLSKERDSLAQTSKKLARDLQKVRPSAYLLIVRTYFVGVVLCCCVVRIRLFTYIILGMLLTRRFERLGKGIEQSMWNIC
jgi:hypothetical protein